MLISNLQELIEVKKVTRIKLFEIDDSAAKQESTNWVFEHGHIKADTAYLGMNRLASYRIEQGVLSLYFIK